MVICTVKFDRKKAVFFVILAALLLIAVILLASAGQHPSKDVSASVPETRGRTEKNRINFLSQYGWEVESPALREDCVIIPREFNQVFENYNALQKQQGFDLSEYAGCEVKLYTYRIVNSGIGDQVVAVLYVSNGIVIGGDVHSTALDGYMCGVKR